MPDTGPSPALAAKPGPALARTPGADALAMQARFQQAVQLAEAGDLDAAEQLYRALMSGRAPSATLRCKFADLLIRKHQHDEAFELLDAAIRQAPGMVWSYLVLASLHEAEERPLLALAALEAGLRLGDRPDVVAGKLATLRARVLGTPPARILVADATEDDQGRALMLISALHHAAPRLGRVMLRLVGVAGDPVRAAAEALAWDRGLEIEFRAAAPAALAGAAAYAAVAFRRADHLDPCRAEAARLGLPQLVAVQFPGRNAAGQVLALQAAAHDPRKLAEAIVRMLEPS